MPDGTPLLILGLSAENLTRLMDARPITLNTKELGMPELEIIIMYGQTEEQIAKQLGVPGAKPPTPDKTDFYYRGKAGDGQEQ